MVYVTDSQAAKAVFERMWSKSPAIFNEVRQTLLLAAQHDVELEFHWVPREDQELRHADYLSKLEDKGAVIMQQQLFERICRTVQPGSVCWKFPTIDVFGGLADKEHKSAIYYTLHMIVGSAGVDGLVQSWSRGSAEQRLCWVFPPLDHRQSTKQDAAGKS